MAMAPAMSLRCCLRRASLAGPLSRRRLTANRGLGSRDLTGFAPFASNRSCPPSPSSSSPSSHRQHGRRHPPTSPSYYPPPYYPPSYSTVGQSSTGASSQGPPKSRTPSFDREVVQLAALPLHPLTLTDLVRFGKPPLPPDQLLASAAFTLRVLPIRLARRIISLRNLPYIVVSNPHISQIYNNYLHSLRLLLSFPKHDFPTSLKEEARFYDVLSEIVDTHRNTIPVLARGFTECKRYVTPEVITDFLDEHLRARIGTRLLAEQHLALHDDSLTRDGRPLPGLEAGAAQPTTYIGTIDTHLNPTRIVRYCADFVGDICDLRYGVRPTVVVDGMTDAKFAYVPSHLEYIMTELLKNAFRATIEHGNVDKPVIVTIASAGMENDDSDSDSDSDGESYPPPPHSLSNSQSHPPSISRMLEIGNNNGGGTEGVSVVRPGTEIQGDGLKGDMQLEGYASDSPGASSDAMMKTEAARAVTIRIRDRGGGIAPEHLPLIFSYSFSTFNPANTFGGGGNGYYNGAGGGGGGGGMGLDALSSAMNDMEASTIAGLGFGMGLSRSYAQFFGGDLKVESLFGWGTDVYLGLRGLDIDRS
ncbi:hypothetical protein TWF696_005779 [Orbilia brochopaga]|uniref:Protein-serine/threonine kinase n=1 Tax=Orbilia brochopaga TaxID=3140254 RepID=A0AAV9V0N5_9PEZI